MRVAIVDDESIVRIGLKSIIDWESYGFQLVGQASDGSKAYDLIIEQEPDIVITDIKMPVMDGLELIKSFKGLNKGPRFIVLSSYDDFHLVKEAMKLGVEDYILKLEIQPEVFINILNKVAINIKKERERVLKKSSIDKQITKSLNIMRRNFFRDIINNRYANEMELNEAMELFNIQMASDYIYCLTIKVGELHRFESVTHEELFVLNSSIINICEEIANDDFNGYCFEGKTGEFFVLFSHKANINEKIHEEKLLELADRLRLMLEQYLNINPIIGIGEGKNGLKGIVDAFRKSLYAIGERFYKDDSKVILWTHGKDNKNYKEDYSILSIKEKFHKALSFYKKEDLKEIFESILDDISVLSLGKGAIYNIIFEIFYMISEFCMLYDIKATEIMNKSYRTHHQLLHIKNIMEAQTWIKEVRDDLINYLEKEDQNTYLWHIKRAIEYMENNFTEDISLKEVADKVSLNPSYFSTLLKKYTDMSYSDYIAQMRVKEAKKLLLKSNDKVYEIGEKVGYHNNYYFNRIFKKITGLTPGQYREKNLFYK